MFLFPVLGVLFTLFFEVCIYQIAKSCARLEFASFHFIQSAQKLLEELAERKFHKTLPGLVYSLMPFPVLTVAYRLPL